MPSSVPIQAPGDRVPDKNQQKPGAVSPPNPQQQQQRRQREEKLEKWRKQKAIPNDPSANAACEKCAIRRWTFGVLFFESSFGHRR